MNRFSQLNQDQMLELCNIIKPDGNWKFFQLMNESPIESAESDDNIYEFTTDDNNDIVQFYPHEEDGGGVRCYIDHNGDMDKDWIPEEKSEFIDLYLKKISPDYDREKLQERLAKLADDTSHSKEEDEIVVGTDIKEDSKQESKNKLNSEPESNKWYNTGYLWLVLVLFWPVGVYGIYRRFLDYLKSPVLEPHDKGN